MIILAFLSISILIAAGIRYDQIKEELVPYILIAIYATSLLPSLQIPYIIDDTDHLHQLSLAMESSHVMQWLFTPHNEHVIPFLKSLYYIFYKNFWLNPQAFHLVIIAICTGILTVFYHLLRYLTQSRFSAFIGITLLAANNMPDLAIFVITNSHIVFCLFFLLLLFYAQYRYLTDRKKRWGFVIILSAVLASSTFSLGITSIFLAFLFERLCIPRKIRKENGSAMMVVLIGWALGLIPYLLSLDAIIHTRHYQDLGASSAFQIMNIGKAAQYLCYYIYRDLIPGLLPNAYLSIGLFFLATYSCIVFRKQIEWKKIIFFALLGSLINFIIYTFRIAWGPHFLDFARYNVFPGLGMCAIYIIILNPLLKNKESVMKDQKYRFLIYLLPLILVSYSGMTRYSRAELISSETNPAIQRFNIELRSATVHYFNDNPRAKNLTIKNSPIIMPRPASLKTKNGNIPDLSRYPRTINFYAQYVVPKEIRDKILFGPTTDPAFLNYLSDARHENAYSTFISVIR